ncbi:MAG TPA: VCBS repeat-containing protein [Gemmataceae bacterium]|nr:VCBS repeat-containing protein [Gemmataceae bacterium]
MFGLRARSSFLVVAVAVLVCGAFALASLARHLHPSVPPVLKETTPLADAGVAQQAPLGLDDTEKAFIWDIEHHGNLLNKFGFKVLADNLARGDAQALAEAFAADFRGQLPHTREVQVKRDYVEATRDRAAGPASEMVARDQFLSGLMAYRERFAQPPKVEMKLMNLAPVARKDVGGAWQGSCYLRMAGEMAPGQPGEVSLQMQYQIVQPTEENLQKGGWLQTCTVVQSQLARAPHFLMRDATAERGIDAGLFHDNWVSSSPTKHPNTGGVFLCDFDRDGVLDMLVVDVNRYVLYKGLPGGKFIDVTRQVGLPEHLDGDADILAGFVDIDGDGWDDLILGGRVYRNEEGRRFVDYTKRTNLEFRKGVSGIAVADYDRDGRLDIYVSYGAIPDGSSWLDGKSAGGGNQLFRNQGNWRFEDVTARAGAGGGRRSTFTAVWLDANNDGWPDLYVINEFGTGVLLVNQGNGTFREQALAGGPNDFGSMGAVAGDYDNDGNIDIYVGNMYSKAGCRVIGNVCPGTYPEPIMDTMRHFVTGSQLWRNQGKLGFEPLGKDYGVAAVGWAYGPALVDLDNDGWLDIYATAGFISQSRSDPDG